MWIFVNGKLALDLGRVHGPEERTINFDLQSCRPRHQPRWQLRDGRVSRRAAHAGLEFQDHDQHRLFRARRGQVAGAPRWLEARSLSRRRCRRAAPASAAPGFL
jgi:hypothetical protein